MIGIRDLEVAYEQDIALKQLNMSVPAGATCAVIGPSGCGKTTLLYALAGLVRPQSGEIAIAGAPLSGLRQGTGLILQDYGLLPWKTVYDNLAFPLKARGGAGAEVNDRVGAMLAALGLESLGHRLPGELSGGQKQRVAIGRTLVLEPDLLLMDEASSALDALTKERIQDLVLEAHKARGFTLVVVTHNIEEAAFLGQRIFIMSQGRITSVLENPHFGEADFRDHPSFFELRQRIRRHLYEAN
ncbi:ABC transporter ATP-binding protein [Acidaminobacter hydrogenoformans]|uniref:NitT/TauT family transport system ATP-binding protein n=1 Tax=Acidaminobacter hydrogenoformans DSM 2784 TaxID=1120920 RepID=A0A1G5RTC0_9FIRM|nr:ABC transporter ATP-binding protein [Acidaminobacter hydrogenoformans]SCZ77362.1 NitT/TauT family transport system ATP-binding protein [Acidaminobacter hydrogenoformans DSM 2784]